MFLKTKTEVYNTQTENLGLEPEYAIINMVIKLDSLVGVREFIADGRLDTSRCVIILQTGEEYGILTPYTEVVSLLCPPVTHSTITEIDNTTLTWVAEPVLIK